MLFHEEMYLFHGGSAISYPYFLLIHKYHSMDNSLHISEKENVQKQIWILIIIIQSALHPSNGNFKTYWRLQYIIHLQVIPILTQGSMFYTSKKENLATQEKQLVCVRPGALHS